MKDRRSYGDGDLTAAVAGARSWRGVLRSLGLAATSSAAIRSVRQHADRLGLDYGHFTGQRRWTEAQLEEAVRTCASWGEVTRTLGLAGGSSQTALRGHAVRLGMDTQHLSPAIPTPSGDPPEMKPDLGNLPRAGSLLAASWFALCGHDVSWPLEPCRYDLLVRLGERVERVQVKSTTVRQGKSWVAWISNTRKGRVPYGPDEIDQFFLIDGDLDYFLIPYAAVGGLHAISLMAYSEFRLNQDFAPTRTT